ncbi:MAG: hypothetical protein WAX89_03975 [Alphaproteobacteria bacterium]
MTPSFRDLLVAARSFPNNAQASYNACASEKAVLHLGAASALTLASLQKQLLAFAPTHRYVSLLFTCATKAEMLAVLTMVQETSAAIDPPGFVMAYGNMPGLHRTGISLYGLKEVEETCQEDVANQLAWACLQRGPIPGDEDLFPANWQDE